MVTCASCGRENPEGFRFCPHCGQPIGEAPAAETERKVVTVLFCDLAGFTARSDNADPEDVRAILRPFHALARTEIERHGGTLDKFIGDAAMGVFGSPVAHEDDPERAVRAALRILEGGRTGEPLGLRVGVNTGQAIVTLARGVQEGENVAGDVVNTASRLQTAAPVGAVVVGESTYRATRGIVEYEELEPIKVKGKAAPLRVWRALAVAPIGRSLDRTGSAPFVGRDLERGLLEQTFRRAVTQRSVQLVTVVGEPGVGKSRLVEEFRSAVSRLAPETAVEWRRGRCLPYGDGVTFWALGEILKDQAGILESDPQDARDEKLGAVVAAFVPEPPERAWIRGRLAPLVGAGSGPAVDRQESFAAWRRFLEAVALAHPLVAVFEDVHWADQAMISFLEHLVEQSAGVPMLVIATARPELYERYPTWGAGVRNATALSLPPLTEEETAELVASLLRAPTLSPEARTLLLERSGGNPLYAEEFVQTLHDRGLVDQNGRLVEDVGELEFPVTVQALIAARLDTLPVARKRVLQDASVVGNVFWSGAVALLGGLDEDAVRSELRELVKIELVRQATPSTVEDQAEFAFWHTLVRDVAYEQIPRAARAEKHRAAARWLESMAEGRVGDVAEILAHHALSALELLRSVPDAEQLEELETAGARYLRLAATRTMALDVSKAEGQLRQALDLIPGEHPDRPRLQAALAEAAFLAGRLEEADGAYEEAIAGLKAQGEVGEAADAMVRRSVVLEYRGEVAAARSILSEAVGSLDPASSGAELARALATSAGGLMIAGRYREAIEQADRAIELAEAVGEVHASARAHGFRGYSKVVALGDLDGLSEQRKALEMLLSLGAGRTAAIVYHNLVGCLLLAEGPRSALELLSEAEEFAEGRGLREMVLALRNQRVTTLFQTGDWDELLRLAEEVASEARRQGSGYDEAFVEADRAFVLACRRDPAALELCGSALALARAVHEPPILLRALGAAALARSTHGDRAGALGLVEEALEVTEGEGAIVRLTELPHLVRLAVTEVDHPLADRLMEGTEPGRLEWYRLSRTSARAVVDEARGDPDGALRGYEEAWEGWSEWGHALERAHALAGAGRCLAATGQDDQAAKRFGAARAAFDGLGMTSEDVAAGIAALSD